MVKIPKKVSDRFVKQVRNFQGVLQRAKARDVNESDTVTIITDMLDSVFGFDKYTEVTKEYAIKSTYCDLAVKMDGSVKYLIEVKAIGLDLKENHLRQAVNYGLHHDIQWVVLTNGIEWEVHRIRFERPVESDLVCSFDFLELKPRRGEDQERLFILCKEGIRREAIKEFVGHAQVVNRFKIAAIIQEEPVVAVIRSKLKKMWRDVKVTKEEIGRILVSEVLKREVVEGELAKEAMKQVKKAMRQVKKAAGKPPKNREVEKPAASPALDSGAEQGTTVP